MATRTLGWKAEAEKAREDVLAANDRSMSRRSSVVTTSLK